MSAESLPGLGSLIQALERRVAALEDEVAVLRGRPLGPIEPLPPDGPTYAERRMLAEAVLEVAASRHRLTRRELIGPARCPPVARVRMLAMHVARKLSGLSLAEIGQLFGGRHHTTVLVAYQKAAEARARNPMLEGDARWIEDAARERVEAARPRSDSASAG